MRDKRKGSAALGPSGSTRPVRATNRGVTPFPRLRAAGLAVVAGASIAGSIIACSPPMRLGGVPPQSRLPEGPTVVPDAATDTTADGGAKPPIQPIDDIPTAGVPPAPERPGVVNPINGQ